MAKYCSTFVWNCVHLNLQCAFMNQVAKCRFRQVISYLLRITITEGVKKNITSVTVISCNFYTWSKALPRECNFCICPMFHGAISVQFTVCSYTLHTVHLVYIVERSSWHVEKYNPKINSNFQKFLELINISWNLSTRIGQRFERITGKVVQSNWMQIQFCKKWI